MPKSVEEILIKNIFVGIYGKCPYCKKEIGLKGFNIWMKPEQITSTKADLLKLIMEVKPKERPYEGGRNRRAKLYNSALAEWEEKIKEIFK